MVVEYGNAGEETYDMYQRCQKILKLNEQNQFKIAIILGGTNDVGDKSSKPEIIFKNLKNIHELCINNGMLTICLTIPENCVVSIIMIDKF